VKRVSIAILLGSSGCISGPSAPDHDLSCHWSYSAGVNHDPAQRTIGDQLERISGCRGEVWIFYPKTWDPRHRSNTIFWGALAYEELGMKYEAANELPAASRAFWSALEMVGTVTGYRTPIESVRAWAFEGLARVAHKRAQPTWSALLAQCAALANGYLDSKDGRDDRRIEAQLDEGFDKMLRAQLDAEAAIRRASIAAGLQGGIVIAGISQRSISVSAAINGIADVMKQQGQVDEAFGDASKKIADAMDMLRSTATTGFDDLPTLEAGKSFIGEQVTFYLGSSPRPDQVIVLLKSGARTNDWEGVLAALRAIEDPAHPGVPETLLLVREYQKLEMWATIHERRRR